MLEKNIADIRKEYTKGVLEPKELGDNPIVVFQKWFDEALKSEVLEVNAMALATVSPSGAPSVRIVLLKEITEKGIVFFTNYKSRKGREIEDNQQVAVVFYWAELERQVRIEGRVRKIREEDSDVYFYSRPRISQAGAVVSPQSEKIGSREILDAAMEELLAKDDAELQRPKHWGGYEIEADAVEFWQGRPGRVHDRAFFEKNEGGTWNVSRLAP